MSDWHQRFARYYEEVLRASAQSSGRTLTRLDRLLNKHLACDLAALDIAFDQLVDRDEFVLTLQLSDLDALEVESDDLEEGEEDTPDDRQILVLSDGPADGRADREHFLAVKAARKIQRTQVRDPYNRETSLGAPVVRVKSGKGVEIGPLFYWEVSLKYDPGAKRLTVTKNSPIPDLNIMLLEPSLEEAGDIDAVTGAVRDSLLKAPGTIDSIRSAIRTIAGLVDHWDQVSLEKGMNLAQRDWIREPPGERPELNRRGVLLNAPRSHAFLFQDLRKIASLQTLPSGGPLDILTKEADPERDALPPKYPLSFSDTKDGGDPLWFPFESNPAQRRIGALAERARILTVQGPPGTGKSQTISNLVCHLVASGHSVLVTSHQRKAVEVVSGLLKPLPRVALPLLQGDKASSKQLESRIQRFLEDHTLDVDDAEGTVDRGMEALRRLDRNLRVLAHRFQELSRKEHEEWGNFETYEDLRRWDHIHEDDEPTSAEAELIVRSLPEWCSLRLRIGDHYHDLTSLICPEAGDTTGATEAAILGDFEALVTHGERLRDAPTPELIRHLRQFLASSDSGPESASILTEALLGWIEAHGWAMVETLEQSSVSLGSTDEFRQWVLAARSVDPEWLSGREARSRMLVEWFEDPANAEPSLRPIEEPGRAVVLEEAAEALRRSQGRWIAWHVRPAVRKARRVIGAFLDREIDRAHWRERASEVDRAVDWSRAERQLLELSDELRRIAPLDSSESPPAPGMLHRIGWREFARNTHAVSAFLARAPAAPDELWPSVVGSVLSRTSPVLARRTMKDVERALRAVREELERERWLAHLWERSRFPEEWRERFSPLITDLRDGQLSNEGVRILDWLMDQLGNGQNLHRIRSLERSELASLPSTLTELQDELLESGRVPEWVESHLPEALQAHRLGALLKGSLASDPDDISSVAAGLRKGEEQRKEILFHLVQHRHRLNQAKAVHAGNVNAELQRVRQLLRGPTRLRSSLMALREQIDYGTVLKVFPAWICTIDDACRLFPPKPHLFDYVIVDEASQCAQPALLPLALRCDRLVVVGDEQQLRPSFGRFLPETTVQSLREKHGLSSHRAGIFTQGKESLLDLASFRSTSSGFLDEHFRCDPSIIQWSNGRFYDNQLKILTHRRPHSFRPALRLRQLSDADDDQEQKRNVTEAKAVVAEVRRLTDRPENESLTIGVISPFRRQADLIQGLLEKEFERDPDMLERHRIIASTADGFQGDERDIVLYSFRVGPSSNPNTLGVLERDANRFNVAFTRARRLGISFLSASPSRLPTAGVTRSWIEHTQIVEDGAFPADDGRPDHFDSEFERKVCGRLRDRGLRVATQEPCGPFRIDLVVRDAEGRTLAVECDGEWKRDEFGNLRPEDYQRQDLIERAGWVVHRVSGRRYLLDPHREIEEIVSMLKTQPTEEEVLILTGDRPLEEYAPLDEAQAEDPDAEETVESEEGVGLGIARPEGHRPTAPYRDEPRVEERLVFGKPESEIRPQLRQLVRWSLQGSHVKRSMFDRLVEVGERLEDGERLTDADVRALEFIRRIAESQGFDLEGEVPL